MTLYLIISGFFLPTVLNVWMPDHSSPAPDAGTSRDSSPVLIQAPALEPKLGCLPAWFMAAGVASAVGLADILLHRSLGVTQRSPVS